jgi:hypothetical protein
MADSYVETPEGLLLVANGFDAVLRWDGFAPTMYTAGTEAPLATPSLSGSGTGAIVGTYYGYLRYVDNLDNFSNLSPISAAFLASGGTGTITGATNATPIVITSAAHGLATDDVVSISGVGGNTSANNTWIITVIDANTFSLDNASGTAAYTGGGTWISGIATVTYSGLETPTDPKIRRRQVLRNLDGEATTFYVDIDTNDLTSTSLSSTQDDEQLATGIAVPILDSQGLPFANSNYPPPNTVSVLCPHQDRMFGAVIVYYTQGNIQVQFGSKTVQGVGTEWMATLAGRYLFAVGASTSYLIDSVDVVNQILTLDTAWLDPTDNFLSYAIRPDPTQDRLVYYSSAGLPESWSPLQAISVEADGDVMTALMSQGSFLFIIELNHIYRFTFQNDPGIDGAVFLSVNRGCINHRCWINVEGQAYMLDFQGIHSFDGGQSIQPVGAPVQQIFRPGEIVPYKINWAAAPYFHASLFATQQTIRWFVAMAGDDLPRHAIAYNYRLQRWWIESFRVPIGAADAGYSAGIPQVFLGSSFRTILVYWQGYLDNANPAEGTVRGAVATAGLLSVTDLAAVFAADIVGAPVAIVAGSGKGQMRQIVNVVDQTLYIDQPWSCMPDATSTYQVGAINWLYRCAWFPWMKNENYNERRFQLLFEPCHNPITLDMRLLEDFNTTPVMWATTVSSDQGDGVATDASGKNIIIDLTRPNGVVQKRFGSQRELYTTGSRYGQCELSGFTNNDQVSVYQITFDGVTPAGGA